MAEQGRSDGDSEPIDPLLEEIRRGNVIMDRIEQEFELNREVMAVLLKRTGDNHREVMRRLEDLGVHMREQTRALMRMNEKLGPGEQPI